MKNSIALLPTAYLAPVQYYTKLLKYDEAHIEHYEHFPKQTYRNRCNIYGANGLLSLTIPLKKRGERILTKDIRISYDQPWQNLHWRSFQASYRSSPFFEYYEDDLAPFYEKQFGFLIDYNAEMHKLVCGLLKISDNTKPTTEYEKEPASKDDFRSIISPKCSLEDDRDFIPQPYSQVFETKFGFLPNLSIADLLFNHGPKAKDILEL